MPLVTPEKAAENWAQFEALKAKLLSGEDYQTIAGKRYIKRSGFRKIAVYFGISDRIIKEERLDREDGTFSWRIEVEAYAPNGRSCIGVGACDSKERKFARSEHDVFATAHTRAKSRAISDLVAGGAVSAEEVSPGDFENTDSITNSKPNGQEQNKIPEKQSNPIQQEIIKVPVTKEVLKIEGLRQFPLTDGTKVSGMINVFDDEISIVPEVPIASEGPTIKGFLVPKILEPMHTKHGIVFNLITESDNLTAIIIKGKLSDQQIKETQTSSRWAFAKAIDNQQTPPSEASSH
jgi:hypothetical protein